MLGVAFTVFVLVVTFGGLGVYFFFMARRRACGFWPWEVSAMRREGTRATALVLNHAYQSSGERGSMEYELIVEVRPPNGTPFRTKVVYVGPTFSDDNREGAQLPVFFRPTEPQRILIDFEALERAKRIAAGEANAREEQRKRDLLAGKGP